MAMKEAQANYIRVVYIDDHDFVRIATKKILNTTDSIRVIGDAKSAESAIPTINKLHPDVVLLDLDLPGIKGDALAETLISKHPEIKILIITAFKNKELASRLIKLGVRGYLNKGADLETLITAVEKVSNGEIYIDHDIAMKMLQTNMQRDGRTKFDLLSDRENEICLMLCNGLSLKDVAKKLSRDESTIRTHRMRIFKKLNVKNDVELVTLALRHGVIQIDELNKPGDD